MSDPAGTPFGLSPLALSDEEVDQNYGYRERYEGALALENADGSLLEGNLPREIADLPAHELLPLVSDAAHALVLEFEVAGKQGYERRYKHPCWPGLTSGITIGFGYDIGYNSLKSFERGWKTLLAEQDFNLLVPTVDKKGEAAKALLAAVKHLVVPWAAAETVYRNETVPTFVRLVLATFPNARDLHPDSFGALFSLVYNRGASLSGPRRQHMRNIHQHMEARQFSRVPKELRDMKVLWGSDMSGLHRRRDAEARLFEDGLLATSSASVVKVASTALGGSRETSPEASSPARPDILGLQNGPTRQPAESLEVFADSEGDWAGQPDDITADMAQPAPTEATLESTPPWMGVSWVAQDDSSTEYRHVVTDDRPLKDCEFELTGRDLELLIRSNSFEPDRKQGKIIFGLRGALLLGSTSQPDDRLVQIDRAALRLKEARPDHATFRCVIGVYDLGSNRLSGFAASTVAKRGSVYAFAKASGEACNLLPGGCYTYVVGPHRKKAGCLRETEPYGVLRNKNNLTYDVKDVWDDCFPADNIHPAFVDGTGSADFSSLGCQVIKGTINLQTGEHVGPWAKFRTALGLTMPAERDHGKNFSYVLLTGLEAAIAARLRDEGKDVDLSAVLSRLGRLRQGSAGEHVKRLQVALNVAATGKFDSKTKVTLAKLQTEKLGAADGIYAPAMDEALGFNIFKTASAGRLVLAGLPGQALESVRDPLESLYYEIGRRAVIARKNPQLAADPELPQLETVTRESLAEVLAIGQRLFARLERSVYELICADSVADAADRDTIQQSLRDAARLGTDQLIERLTDVLVTGLGVISPIAAVVAKIIVTKVLEPALSDTKASAGKMIECACKSWTGELNKRVLAAGIQDAAPIAVAQSKAASTVA